MSFDNKDNILNNHIYTGITTNGQDDINLCSNERGELRSPSQLLSPSQMSHLNHSVSNSESDSESDDDEYYLSDDEELNNMASGSHDNHNRMNYSASISDNVAYLSNSLSHALDSLQLDKSLVLQAQLSGYLNNEKQKVIDKNKQVIDRMENIKKLYAYNFALNNNNNTKSNNSRVEKLKQDITELESRIEKLKIGVPDSNTSTFRSIFKSKSHTIGAANKYPVEYNQSKDKVLERQIEE